MFHFLPKTLIEWTASKVLALEEIRVSKENMDRDYDFSFLLIYLVMSRARVILGTRL